MYKAKNTHAEILFCEVDLLFGHVIVAVSWGSFIHLNMGEDCFIWL